MQKVEQTLSAVQALAPIAKGEYDLTDRECTIFRRRLYALNKNNAGGWRWRTLREGGLLLVWRLN